MQQESFCQAEDGSVGTNAESQRASANQRCKEMFRQHAKGITNILTDGIH